MIALSADLSWPFILVQMTSTPAESSFSPEAVSIVIDFLLTVALIAIYAKQTNTMSEQVDTQDQRTNIMDEQKQIQNKQQASSRKQTEIQQAQQWLVEANHEPAIEWCDFKFENQNN